MPEKIVETPYPLIDADPHFSRVMRYMRPSDYAVWAGSTGAFPSAVYLWVRFWGWTENKAEEERDLAELSQRAKDGLPLYGESDQPLWVQGAAYRNSAFSQLKFSSFPMFNFVNHPSHGTDPAKYGVKVKSESEQEYA
ncbi:hypothetical protein BV25DRAFT_1841673 [Artomyces pyxidatus]|uniref:Uncharacterized protein n=1 Tax=Artomyces pyxidatus TaxID=48021 RepID=A0ACB8SMY9_9AGAM|nr:hypothetical protein BV25DRAFT_1841673 [Artomyces pyxidatus]